MALATYVTAGWSMRALVERRWRDWPLALFWVWLSVDGVYCAALLLSGDGHAIGLMREANAPASTSLFMAYGLVLMYEGPLSSISAAWHRSVNDS